MPSLHCPTQELSLTVSSDACLGSEHCGDSLQTLRKFEKLHALRPTPLLPCRLATHRPQAVDLIKQIEFLEVTRNRQRTDRIVYCIKIYHRKTPSRIPVHGQFGRSSSLPTSIGDRSHHHNGKPTRTVQVAYDDFLQLRNDAYELARSSHLLDVCPLCHPVMSLNMVSALRPRWNTHYHKTSDEVCEMLTAYLNAMIKLVVAAPTGGDDHCYGKQQIPKLLQRFLRTHEHERTSM
jgi:hypothetical protein